MTVALYVNRFWGGHVV